MKNFFLVIFIALLLTNIELKSISSTKSSKKQVIPANCLTIIPNSNPVECNECKQGYLNGLQLQCEECLPGLIMSPTGLCCDLTSNIISNGICCPNNTSNILGTSLCCAPNQIKAQNTGSYPDICCMPDHVNKNGICCRANSEETCCGANTTFMIDLADNYTAQCCPANTIFASGQCCPISKIAGNTCCSSSQIVSNGICCNSGYTNDGGICCASNFYNSNGMCCQVGYTNSYGMCCPNGQYNSNGLCCSDGSLSTYMSNSMATIGSGFGVNSSYPNGKCCQSGFYLQGNSCCNPLADAKTVQMGTTATAIANNFPGPYIINVTVNSNTTQIFYLSNSNTNNFTCSQAFFSISGTVTSMTCTLSDGCFTQCALINQTCTLPSASNTYFVLYGSYVNGFMVTTRVSNISSFKCGATSVFESQPSGNDLRCWYASYPM